MPSILARRAMNNTTRQRFDSADWAMAGSEATATTEPDHEPETFSVLPMAKKILEMHMRRKRFDSADWVLEEQQATQQVVLPENVAKHRIDRKTRKRFDSADHEMAKAI